MNELLFAKNKIKKTDLALPPALVPRNDDAEDSSMFSLPYSLMFSYFIYLCDD